jgi:hypothetical protein
MNENNDIQRVEIIINQVKKEFKSTAFLFISKMWIFIQIFLNSQLESNFIDSFSFHRGKLALFSLLQVSKFQNGEQNSSLDFSSSALFFLFS